MSIKTGNHLAGTGFNTLLLWDDINFNGLSLAVGNSAPDLITLYGSNILGRAFDGNLTMEQLFSSEEVLHGYKEGTGINFHIHWRPTTANTGDVKWNIEFVWQNVETEFNPSMIQNISVISAASGSAWTSIVTGFDIVSGEGMEVGSQIEIRVYRDPSDIEDTYPDDAVLTSVGIHYQIHSDGTRSFHG